MSRAITNPNQEQKRIAKLSSSLTPIDVFSDNRIIGMSYDDFVEMIDDAYWYNDSYYYETQKYPSTRVHQYGICVDQCKEYVVLRFVVFDTTYNGHRSMCTPQREGSGEVYQRWISPEGKEFVMARALYNKRCEYWRTNTPLRLVEDSAEYQNHYIAGIGLNRYPKDAYKYNLYERLLAYKGDDYCVNDSLDIALAFSPMGEWLNKCHHKLFAKILRMNIIDELMECERQFRIAMRGHFRFTYKNIQMWMDYAKMLKDNLPNAAYQRAYLCPQNLKHAHDWITRIDTKRRAKEEVAAKAEKAKAALQDFLNHHAELMNINIGDGKIELHSLNSPTEYIEEGAMMHHCVGAYYDKPTSLIFSARDAKTGERIATIEVSTKTQDIVQVRGVCNKDVKEDEEIRSIIEANMPKIKKRIAKQAKRKEVA